MSGKISKKSLEVAIREIEKSMSTLLEAAKKYHEILKIQEKPKFKINKKIYGLIDYESQENQENQSQSSFMESLENNLDEEQAWEERFGIKNDEG